MKSDEVIVVLTSHPVSQDFETAVEAGIGDRCSWVTLASIRRDSVRNTIRTLRAMHCSRVYVAIESESDRIVLPILEALVWFVPTKSRNGISSNLEIRQISLLSVVLNLLRIVSSSLKINLLRMDSQRRVNKLARSQPLRPSVKGSESILYINANLWFGVKAGGSVGHVAGVINSFIKSGVSVFLASLVTAIGVSHRAVPVKLNMPTQFGVPWESNYYGINQRLYRSICRVKSLRGIDAVYQRMSVGSYLGVQVSRRFKIPFILEYNGSETWIARNWGKRLRFQDLAEQIEDLNLSHADLIVTVSEELRRDLIRRNVNPERIVMYPNCVDPTMFDPDRFSKDALSQLKSSYGIPDSGVVVGFVGTFGAWHGADVLARAIRIILTDHSEWAEEESVYFMLVGDGERMSAVIHELGDVADSARVIRTGLVPQMKTPEYLGACDILVSPHVPNEDGTPFFGSPTKLFEYMAMGKAIIASDLDQIGEILSPQVPASEFSEFSSDESKQVALLVTPGIAEEIVQAVMKLVDDRVLRQQLGRNARKLALERFTWERHVEAILRGLRNIEDLKSPSR